MSINKFENRLYDWTFEHGTRKSVAKFYAVTKSSRKYFESFLISNCAGKRVLEYGCGAGSYAFFLKRHGANVVAIEISEEAINVAREQAIKEGLEIDFFVMDAEAMKFEDSSFDLVCGVSILHHLHLDKALREITRVLSSEGRAIFIEPMGHNPAINIFRKLTPHLRDPDEHPLTIADLSLIKSFFHETHFEFFHLLSLLAVPFRKTKIFSHLLNLLDWFDKIIFKLCPFLRPFAWQVVIICEIPRKKL